MVMNAHKNTWSNRATKEFRISVKNSKDGFWRTVLHKILEDTRIIDKPPLKTFLFKARRARFLKFELISFYGDGCGLQFLAEVSGSLCKMC